MLIPHPLLGLRDAQEFTYLGDASLMTPPEESPPDEPAGALSAEIEAALSAHVYLRDNPAGVHRELWFHEHGDRSWLIVTRDTVTHEILGAELAREAPRGAGRDGE